MTKPLSLLIADELEQAHPHEAAAELRRQHALIGELVEAIGTAKTCISLHCQLMPSDAKAWAALQDHLATALERAKEQS